MRIVTKVPLRVSFFGGGSDIPPYCYENGGEILFCTINKYAYCEIEEIEEKEKIRLGNRNEEYKDGDSDYTGKYGIVKAALQVNKIHSGCRIKIKSDVPQGTGLGGSSAQMVAIVLALYKWEGKEIDKRTLVKLAYHIEREVMGIKGGYQDPITTAYGGIGYLKVKNIDDFEVEYFPLKTEKVRQLRSSFLLYFTGEKHNSSIIMEKYINNQKENQLKTKENMDAIKQLAIRAKEMMLSGNVEEMGRLFHSAWILKKNMCNEVSSEYIDSLYDLAMGANATGGKILGSGGGGYLLIFCEQNYQKAVQEALKQGKGFFDTEWDFDFQGARIE